MRRVLVIASVEPGGEWHTVKELVFGLRETKRYTVDIIGKGSEEGLQNIFQRVIILPLCTAIKPLKYLKELLFTIRNTKIAVLEMLKHQAYHAILVTDFQGAIACLTIIQTWSVPVVYYYHGKKSSIITSFAKLNYYEIIVKILERIALFSSRVIVVPSLFGKHIIRKMLLYYPKSILVIPNMLPSAFSNLSLRTKEQSVFTVLYSGRLVEYKGIKLLIEAARQLQYQHIPIVLHICFPSVNAQEDVYAFVEDAAKKHPDYIFLHKDPTQQSLIRIYQMADVMMLPSAYEIAPVSILEALACGTLCIATDTGNAAEVLSSIHQQFVISSRSVESIVKSLCWVYHLPVEKKLLYRKKGRSIARQCVKKRTVMAFDALLRSL